jgi:hypothetical protein
MKRSLLTAFVAAMAMTAVLATVGFGATKKSNKTSSGKTNSAQAQTPTGPPPTMSEMLAKRSAEKTAHQAALAAELGVTAKQLSDAMDSVKSDKLDAAVAANKLTAAERTAIIACESAPLTCDRSDLPAGGPGGPGERGHRGGPDGGPAAIASALAAKLNLPEATVVAALKKTRPARPAGDQRGPGGPRGQAGPAGFAGPMGMN